ncbi:uncharacterized protein EI90DRAFT_908856 [Cantharellus anzutake]|uniref:uncharacterized protein n=1 Tax=Cantharellus anzutake TaxID=1750568 RepID=UPI00190398B8|nr:uncharacterized protein EI90DRAFT_908856 [Cantharellus anzutake]KAF8331984.1 hypothetical protein EI90DRAFT_908856 [Cantharellus anzutake]
MGGLGDHCDTTIIAWFPALDVYSARSNPMIWANYVTVVVPVCCGISGLLRLAFVWGLIANTVRLTRVLANVASPSYPLIGFDERRGCFRLVMYVYCLSAYAGLWKFLLRNIISSLSVVLYSGWVSTWLIHALLVNLFISVVYLGIAMRRLARHRVKCPMLLTGSPSVFATSDSCSWLSEVASGLRIRVKSCVLFSCFKLRPIKPWVGWFHDHCRFSAIWELPNAIVSPESGMIYTITFTISISPAFRPLPEFGEDSLVYHKNFWAWIKTHCVPQMDSSITVVRRRNRTPPSPARPIAFRDANAEGLVAEIV